MLDGSETAEPLDGEMYAKLRRLAAYYMRVERGGHTLQPTALVHEAYLRVYGGKVPPTDDPKHILYTLVKAMREVLIDYARRRAAVKRKRPDSMNNEEPENRAYRVAADVLTIDSALDELSKTNDRQAKVVELRYFAGFTEDEAADLLEVSRETVKLDWRLAKAWLKDRLSRQQTP